MTAHESLLAERVRILAYLRGGPRNGANAWTTGTCLHVRKHDEEGRYVKGEPLGPDPRCKEFFFDWTEGPCPN